jgi:hypothetical protein
MKEIWKDIPDYEDLYEASNLGIIRSKDAIVWNGFKHHLRKGRILKINYSGAMKYGSVTLSKKSKLKTFRVHVLILKTFVGERPSKLQIGHLDGNPQNNCLANLAYITAKQNMHQSYKDSGLGPNRNKLEKKITYNGQTMNMRDWSKSLGGKYNLVSDRLRRGWSVKKALTTPLIKS